jgi:hypothetical protein
VTRERLVGATSPLRRRRRNATATSSAALPHVELGRLAAVEIAARGGAIVDVTVWRRREREAFAQAFAAAARVMFIERGASAHVLLRL